MSERVGAADSATESGGRCEQWWMLGSGEGTEAEMFSVFCILKEDGSRFKAGDMTWKINVFRKNVDGKKKEAVSVVMI